MMFWTRLWITAKWLTLTASVFALAGAAYPPSGFKGHVTIGPLTPVCQAGTPCDGPAKAVTLSFTRNGVVKSVRTTATGTYRVLLHAGFYTVRANRGMTMRPVHVWVHRGQVDTLNFAIDTGIR